MSFHSNKNQSNEFENYNQNNDRKQDLYSDQKDFRSDTNLYEKYEENQRKGQYSGQQQFQKNNPNPNGIPAISPEDFNILRNCNKESFYYRCLPLSVATCALIYYVGRQRNIKPKVWHYMSAAFGGWFFGKLSYRGTCEDKLVHSGSDSPFVKAIRRRRGLLNEDLSSGNRGTFDEMPDNDWESESKSSNSYGAHEFADDKDLPPRLRYDNEESKPQFSTTYDDLRARNRASLKTV